jgi:hypothetical protein
MAYLIPDGKVVAAYRCRENITSRKDADIDQWYSGKAHVSGANVQGLFNPSRHPGGDLTQGRPAASAPSPPPASMSYLACGPG